MKRKKLSFNRTLTGIILVGYISLIILLLLNVFNSMYASRQSQIRTERETMNVCVSQITATVEELDKNLYDVWVSDRDFLALSGRQSGTKEYESAYYLKESLRNKLLLNDSMHGFIIFYANGEKEWYQSKIDALITPEQMHTVVNFYQNSLDQYSWQRSWFALDCDSDRLLTVIVRKNNASLVMIYNAKGIGETASTRLGMDCTVELCDKNPNIDGEESVAYTETLAAGEHVYARYLSKIDQWLILTIPQKNTWINNTQTLICIVLSMASILAIALLLQFLKKDFIRPIRSLTQIMERIGSHDLLEVPKMDMRFDLMQNISDTLGAMVSEIEAQKIRIYEEIIEKQKAQMQYLQLQLRPHFYLNGLKTIHAMALNGDTSGIQNISGEISDHLRYLFQEAQLVRLSDEMKFVENYVSMQEHAFGRSILLRYEIDPAALDWMVPILCIQTFVENSFKYARTAIAGMQLTLNVRVDLLKTEEGNYLDITISDNGHGYSDEILKRINDGNFGDDGLAVGIGNMLRRCKLIYGSRVEINFYNSSGAVSELILPEQPDWSAENEYTDRR